MSDPTADEITRRRHNQEKLDRKKYDEQQAKYEAELAELEKRYEDLKNTDASAEQKERLLETFQETLTEDFPEMPKSDDNTAKVRLVSQLDRDVENYVRQIGSEEEARRGYGYFFNESESTPQPWSSMLEQVTNTLATCQDESPKEQARRVGIVLWYVTLGSLADKIEYYKLQVVRRRVEMDPDYSEIKRKARGYDEVKETLSRREAEIKIWQNKYDDREEKYAKLFKQYGEANTRTKDAQERYESEKRKVREWEEFANEVMQERGATLSVGPKQSGNPKLSYVQAVYVATKAETESFKSQEMYLRKAAKDANNNAKNYGLFGFFGGLVIGVVACLSLL